MHGKQAIRVGDCLVSFPGYLVSFPGYLVSFPGHHWGLCVYTSLLQLFKGAITVVLEDGSSSVAIEVHGSNGFRSHDNM